MTETNFEEALAKIGDSVRDLCAIVGIDTPENLVNIYIDPDGIAIEVTDKLGDVPVSRTVKLNGTITYRKKIEEPRPVDQSGIAKAIADAEAAGRPLDEGA